jgi:hypothetical protein
VLKGRRLGQQAHPKVRRSEEKSKTLVRRQLIK